MPPSLSIVPTLNAHFTSSINADRGVVGPRARRSPGQHGQHGQHGPRRSAWGVLSTFVQGALALSVLSACGDAAPHDEAHHRETPNDTLAEACLHMTNGPFIVLSADVNVGGDLPDVAVEHTAVRIALPPREGESEQAEGGYGGYVDFSSAEAGEVALFFDAPVSLEAFDASGQALEAEPAPLDEACAELRSAFHLDLGVGTTTLWIHSSSAATVTLVHEEEDHEHAHH